MNQYQNSSISYQASRMTQWYIGCGIPQAEARQRLRIDFQGAEITSQRMPNDNTASHNLANLFAKTIK